jgi:hypothetical protein
LKTTCRVNSTKFKGALPTKCVQFDADWEAGLRPDSLGWSLCSWWLCFRTQRAFVCGMYLYMIYAYICISPGTSCPWSSEGKNTCCISD